MIIDLGYINSWIEEPVEYVYCKTEKHKLESKQVGRCVTEYTCPKCQIKFTIDSSD